jgi:hypothetical protein
MKMVPLNVIPAFAGMTAWTKYESTQGEETFYAVSA